jgi:single-stranded-DNA-specific exonuclease
MPLNTVNRNIVHHGLQSLRLQPNPGIKKLIQVSGSKQDSLTTYDLGFILGPRINAVGRLSNPTDALRLLCSQTREQANKFVSILDGYNKERQTLQQESLILAEKNINSKDKLLFVADSSFHPGVIGLIAGRLTEKYYLPSIVISIDNEVSKGSCRSIKELNIIEALRDIRSFY